METVSHRPAFSPHPLALVGAAFACGVLLARFSPLTIGVFVACGAICSALAVGAFVRVRTGMAALLVCAAFLCVGGGLAVAEREGVPRDRVGRFYEEGRLVSGDPVELTGVVRHAVEVAPDGFYVELGVEAIRHGGRDERASGAVELFAPVRDLPTFGRYELLELRRGARVRVLTRLERAEEFRNPGVNSLTEFLERRGLEAVGVIKSPLLVERLGDEPVFVPLVWLERWRARVHGRLTEVFTRETAGVLQAAILGNRHGLSRATAEAMREGGTFHVLVISGLHISFIGGLALFVARKLTRSRAAQFASSACLLWAYAVAVGAEVSVVRAALMFTLVALAPLVARRGGALNALGGAALALLAWRPAELFDPSFQLTFLSVLGIVALGWPLVERLREVGEWRPARETPYPPRAPRWFRALGESLYWSERVWAAEQRKQTHECRLFKTRWAGRLERFGVQRVLRYAVAGVVVSAGVQLMLLPLMVVYFHRLSVASLVLNVFVGALAAAASIGALAAVVVSPFSAPLAAPLAWSVERAVWLMAHSTGPFGGAASVRLPEYAGALSCVYALYYLPLAVLVFALARWRPLELPAPARERGNGKAEGLTDRRDAATRASRTAAEGATMPRGGAAATHARGQARARWRERLRATFGRRLRATLGWLTNDARVRRAAWAAYALASFVVVAHPMSAPRVDGRLRVDFLDVGQGDAALLTLPDGTTVLVDAGGRPSFGARDDVSSAGPGGEAFERDARGVGERVVSEFLWRRGLDAVDYLLATHAHADHIQGLGDVARSFRVRAALAGRARADEPEFAEFSAALGRAGVPLRLVGRGDVLRAGGATMEVLWPPRAPDESAAPRGSPARAVSGNDDSVVLRVRFGRRCFLLTGDIERRAEGALVAAGDDLRCDVVKVAHHGSRTSSTEGFVAATRASFAVVPAGIDSPFGHPEAQTVARWRAAGAEVLQTGRRGTISFVTDGERLSVETFARE